MLTPLEIISTSNRLTRVPSHQVFAKNIGNFAAAKSEEAKEPDNLSWEDQKQS